MAPGQARYRALLSYQSWGVDSGAAEGWGLTGNMRALSDNVEFTGNLVAVLVGSEQPEVPRTDELSADFTTSTDSYGRLRLGEDSIGELTEEDDTGT